MTLYLLPEVNLRLRPQLLEQLQPGTRIVSHSFDMGDWEPEQVVEVDGRTIYVWTVPEEIPENLRQAPQGQAGQVAIAGTLLRSSILMSQLQQQSLSMTLPQMTTLSVTWDVMGLFTF